MSAIVRVGSRSPSSSPKLCRARELDRQTMDEETLRNLIGEKKRGRNMESAQLDVKEYSYFAGNQWREAADKRFFDVHEPYSGKLFARVAAGSRADARVAVDAAAKAFPAWAESTPAERARLFLKASEIVRRRRTEIAEILARETGSTISF